MHHAPGKHRDQGQHGHEAVEPADMLGHEGSGIVVQAGPEVSKVRPGDKVALHWMKGRGIEAETPYYVYSSGRSRGERVNAGLVTTFNEYAVISENRRIII